MAQPDFPIKKGDVVTFTFENHSQRDIPIHPKIYRIREDVTWREVLRDHLAEKLRKTRTLNGILYFHIP
jgi:hypothetical protein